jgi:hypothetical protein
VEGDVGLTVPGRITRQKFSGTEAQRCGALARCFESPGTSVAAHALILWMNSFQSSWTKNHDDFEF